jgi:hypothetical protein
LPEAFTLDSYLDGQGRLSLPIARGLVSWVRKVGAHGRIEFNGAESSWSKRARSVIGMARTARSRRRWTIWSLLPG